MLVTQVLQLKALSRILYFRFKMIYKFEKPVQGIVTHKPSEPCTVTYMVLQMKVDDYYTSHAPLTTKVEHVCC